MFQSCDDLLRPLFPIPGKLEQFVGHEFGGLLAGGFGAALDGPADQGGEGHAAQGEGDIRLLTLTRLDLSTLHNYAYVSRSIPYVMRSERLSWEHHRLLAKLPDGDKQDWIDTCVAEVDAGRSMSTRRLRKSLNLGRVATDADLNPDEADQGIVNHIPFINRLSVWWKHMKKENFLATSTHEQRDALLRDFAPVTAMIAEISHFSQEEDNPAQPLLPIFK